MIEDAHISELPANATRVSAIITTFNRARYLGDALDSVLAQSRPIDEIIVVDDASDDGRTQEVLARYSDRIRLIRNEHNKGKPGSLNAVIPRAEGDYVWLFDDDDIALPDALASHLEFLTEHPNIDFTYSSAYHIDGRADPWDRGKWRLNRLPEIPPEGLLMQTMLSMNTLMQGMLIPRDALETIGLFDETLDRCEDLDMLLRLSRGYRGANIGRGTFLYREHDGLRGAGSKSHSARDRVRVMIDYRKGIFSRLRQELPDAAYLQHAEPSSVCVDDSALCAAARVQRGSIMLRQGLVDEALADFDSALSDPVFDSIRAAWLAEVLSAAFDSQPWAISEPLALLMGLRALLKPHRQTGLSRWMARGTYWSFQRAVSQRRGRDAGQAGLLLSGLGELYVEGHLNASARHLDK